MIEIKENKKICLPVGTTQVHWGSLGATQGAVRAAQDNLNWVVPILKPNIVEEISLFPKIEQNLFYWKFGPWYYFSGKNQNVNT